MNETTILAKCLKHNWPLYFVGKEGYFVVYFLFFLSVLLWVSALLNAYEAFFLIGGVTTILFLVFGIVPAFKRALYIKNIGRYEVIGRKIHFFNTDNKVISTVNFSGRTIKIQKNGLASDIFIGDHIKDLVSGFGEQKSNKPVELCKLENGFEVFDYMEKANMQVK